MERESAHFRLGVAPEVGASLAFLEGKLSRGPEPLLRTTPKPWPQQAGKYASFILAPYSNRIRHARFTFRGHTYQLRPTTPEGHTQHGVVRDLPFTLLEGPELQASWNNRDFKEVNWPWPFALTVRFNLERSLEIHLRLVNLAQEPAPFGLGLHPYFVRFRQGEEPQLRFQAQGVYLTDASRIPRSGPVQLPPELDFSRGAFLKSDLDHVFSGWSGFAELWWPHRGLRVFLEASSLFSHLVVYTAPDGSLALEPVSHATDGINLMARGIAGTGVRVLEPGQPLEGWVRIGWKEER